MYTVYQNQKYVMPLKERIKNVKLVIFQAGEESYEIFLIFKLPNSIYFMILRILVDIMTL